MPFMIGAPLMDGAAWDGLAAFTDDTLNETIDTTAKIPARAIFLSMTTFLFFVDCLLR